ncbi:CHAT domain-containing protein [Rhodoferax sp. GW822-FHT02A01]|uniref:CHAT domain-containing protein n=1 Tax=Rhodoferax sp. GW822-FHT02A01 TaxID=3141537 RepID=UPI00315D6356
MRSITCLLACGLVVLGTWTTGAHAALSGNEQVSLAGRGAFDELVKGLQAQANAGPMKVADWHALCYGYFKLKRYDQINKCLDSLEAALTTARDKRTRLFGLDDATPTAFLMRAETALELGQYDNAVQQAQHARDWYKQDGESEKDILIQALAVQAIALKNLNKRYQADGLLGEIRRVPVSVLGDDEAIGAKSLAQARVSMSLGYWPEALDALALDKTLPLRKFLDNLATGAFLRNENNWVWIELPRAYMENKALLELGERERARRGFESMLKIPQIAANSEIHWMVLADYGDILEKEKSHDQAIEAYRKALTIIESQRASINTEANKIGFIGDKQDVYAKLVALLFSQGRYPEALEVVERSKSRALVDMLASKQRFGAPAGERQQDANIAQALAEVNQKDVQLREQSLSRVRSVESAERGVQSVRMPAELRGLVSVKALRPEEIQALLSADETLLAYFAHGGDMFVLVVQREGITAQKIDSTDLEKDVRRLRASISKRLDVQPLLNAMYQRLIAPVASRIRTPKLTIVAHGALHYLPFAALMDGDQYLVDRYSIRMLPSASVLQFLRPHRSNDAGQSLVLGNPDLHNPDMDLPGAQNEAQTVASLLATPNLLLRDRATKEAFTRLAPSAKYVHVASHGEFDAQQPLASALLLSAPQGQDNRLTVSDMYELGLDAELVTLSACETGLGAVGSGDDVVGLTRGLLYAGASSVVTSLWKVDDESTGQLMAQMYRNLAKNTPDEALRGAQLETRKKFPHPYYWAAFYLTGMH